MNTTFIAIVVIVIMASGPAAASSRRNAPTRNRSVQGVPATLTAISSAGAGSRVTSLLRARKQLLQGPEGCQRDLHSGGVVDQPAVRPAVDVADRVAVAPDRRHGGADLPEQARGLERFGVPGPGPAAPVPDAGFHRVQVDHV